MEILTQYEIPYLHPLAVHFPLVLLLLGAGAAVMYLVFGRGGWRRAGLVLFVLGTLGAWAAERSGHDLYAAVEGDPIVEEIVGPHRDGAVGTVWTSLAAALAFGVVSAARLRKPTLPPEVEALPPRTTPREPVWGRVLVLIPALAAAALVAWTSHLGGLMVWGVPR